MSFFDFFKQPDINEGVQEWKNDHGAVLLDVRTSNEYRQGHIQGSRNIPLQNIRKAKNSLQDPDQAIYIYCLSGARSAQAVSELKAMGYTKVKNIGGINSWHGKVVS